MTYNFTPIVDIVSGIVTNVRAEYDTVNVPAETPYFLHGHPLEIVNILGEKTDNEAFRFKKYPLIILFQDFKERIRPEGRKVSLNIAIVTETQETFYAADRYTNTFTPILYPIWELLHKHILRSSYVDNEELEYDKYDRLFWGKTGIYGNQGNIANDYLDAIEILNLDLEINEDC